MLPASKLRSQLGHRHIAVPVPGTVAVTSSFHFFPTSLPFLPRLYLQQAGSKLYALHDSPAVAPPGSSCSRPGTLEVCQLLHDYRDASGAPNPLRREASFVLNTKGDRRGKAKGGSRESEQKRRPGREDKGASSAKSDSTESDSTKSAKGSKGEYHGEEQGSDANAAGRGKTRSKEEMEGKRRKGPEEREKEKRRARAGEKRKAAKKVPEEDDSLAEQEDRLDPASVKLLLEQMGNPSSRELMNAALAKVSPGPLLCPERGQGQPLTTPVPWERPRSLSAFPCDQRCDSD